MYASWAHRQADFLVTRLTCGKKDLAHIPGDDGVKQDDLGDSTGRSKQRGFHRILCFDSEAVGLLPLVQ